MKFFIFLIMSYIIGSIPSALIVGKTQNIDVREHGSKNIGATNAYRVLGRKYGIIVFLMDMFKGMLPLIIASSFGIKDNYLVLIGFISVIGHTFSIFAKFKGGKGVATSFGMFIFLAPLQSLISIIIFIIIVYFSRYISLGSIISAVVLPTLVLILPVNNVITDKTLISVLSLLLGAYVIYKHKANIKRLINHNENKFNF
ncbi:MAG: acyl phosphate:glycerol-3-phosphate acyltransferase [Fusobacteriaceae bacterium]|nr:acyl-phosphate glycerol-3-phosphate acyltransferase [Fusobacteriales bacterium]MDN5304050.1 acyl phosphate:glycerol-3-phosphate acyltransferase [Fusobacteriaceae bacterium]